MTGEGGAEQKQKQGLPLVTKNLRRRAEETVNDGRMAITSVPGLMHLDGEPERNVKRNILGENKYRTRDHDLTFTFYIHTT